MFAERTKPQVKYFVAAALTLVAVFIVRTAFARIVLNSIDPVASVTDKGRHLIVTGPISCTSRLLKNSEF